MPEDNSQTAVLLVDDEPDILTAHATALEQHYDVETVSSGSEALEAIDDSIDVVFLDRLMPEMSGRETLDALRERGNDVPVCMVTAVEPDVDIIEMPFDDYVTKPVDGTELRKQVEVLVNKEGYVELSRDLYRLNNKKESLEAAGIDDSNSEMYQKLVDRLETLKAERDEDWLAIQEF